MSAAEIKQSIIDPNAKITPGYPSGVMPDTFEQPFPPASSRRWSSTCRTTPASRAARWGAPRAADYDGMAVVSRQPRRASLLAPLSVRPTASPSRSTTTWVIGSGTSSRAFATTPRSSHFDRSGGWVEMITSSAGKARSASSSEAFGS